MKNIKARNLKEINWAIPGQTVTHDEFMSAVRKAEKASFHTVEESMQNFDKWLKSRKKL